MNSISLGTISKIKDGDLKCRTYYTAYTLLFIIFAFFAYLQFLIYDKSFVFAGTYQGGDGLVQHYNAFVYYGQFLRKIVRSFISEHALIIPMWDMNIGFGQDIVSTLSYYVIGDPFAFFSIFIPVRHAEAGYCAFIILRIYFAGLSFSYYCRFRGYKTAYTLVGAIIYCFCSYVLSSAVLHPFFILPMIFLPLLCIGVEKIILSKEILFFSLAVGITVISNFYFSYMLFILIIIYMVIRCIGSRSIIGNIHELFAIAGRFFFSGFTGVCIGGVLLFPSLMTIMSSSRLSVSHFIPLLYTKGFYIRILPAFISGGIWNYSDLGFTSIGLFALVLLFIHRKTIPASHTLISGLILCFIFFCIPFFGHVFNGFSYVTNRWSWAFAALVCYIIVVTLSEVKTIIPKDLSYMIILTLLLFANCIYFRELRSSRCLFAFLSNIVFISALFFRNRMKTTSFTIMLLCFCLISVSVSGYLLYSPHKDNYLANFGKFNSAHRMLVEESPGYELSDISDKEFFRYDTAGIWEVKRNSAMLLKKSGTAYYFSSATDNITQFNRSMNMNDSMDQSRNDLDRRSYLDHLFGVKYIIINNGTESYLPYGYNRLVKSDNERSVYQAESNVPLGVLFDQYMPRNTYDKLDIVRKQQALMQTVVVDNMDIPVKTDIDYSEKVLDYKILSSDGVDIIDNGYSVSKPGAELILEFEPVNDCELYLVYEGIEFEEDAQSTGATTIQMQINSGEVFTNLDYRTWKDNFYCGRKNFLVNLGYDKDERDSITIHFPQTGKITFSNMRLVSQPVAELDNYARKMSEHSLQNLTIDTNCITGDINASKDSILLIQVPYNKGWTAEVDGVKTEILPADDLFMAIKLEKGSHSLVMRYKSNYLIIGSVISGFGILLLLISVIISMRYRSSSSGVSDR